MNRRTVMIILRFAIVIFLIAAVLFFVTDIAAPTFVALVLTIGVCFLVFLFAVVSLRRDEFQPISRKQFWVTLAVGFAVMAVLVIGKVLLVVFA